MKIVLISDTHGKHDELILPEGDMVLHAGDLSGKGSEKEIVDFLNWYSSLPHKYKIFIAGNHDFFMESGDQESIKKIIPDNVIYLNDSGVEIEGINIWGSPIQPWFYDFAFNRQRGEEISKHWEMIPANTDLLITHGPPHKILDKTFQGLEVGCEELIKSIQKLKLKVHLFGHIHEAYGQIEVDGVKYINASMVDYQYEMSNVPIVIDWERKRSAKE